MPADVIVSILRIESSVSPPSSIIEYAVQNHGGAPIWLVVDDFLVWRAGGREITLSLARGRMQPGVEVFGYFAPEVERLAPKQAIERALTLAWPLALDDIWNAERFARPEPGEYLVRIEVGFGRTAKPPDPRPGDSKLEAPVLRWQETATSPSGMLVVPNWQGHSDRSLP